MAFAFCTNHYFIKDNANTQYAWQKNIKRKRYSWSWNCHADISWNDCLITTIVRDCICQGQFGATRETDYGTTVLWARREHYSFDNNHPQSEYRAICLSRNNCILYLYMNLYLGDCCLFVFTDTLKNV